MSNEIIKKCCRCNEIKPISEFYKRKNYGDGFDYYCKNCMCEYRKKWRDNNKGNISIYNKEYGEENKDIIKIYQKKYQKSYQREYSEDQKIKKNERCNEYQKIRRQTDFQYRLNRNVSTAIRLSLKSNKAGRHWEDLVGYTLNELKLHLESQFKLGMSFENYGEWHIDHIIPLSVHNFDSPENIDFKRAWVLQNLQPMWAIENIRKKNKLKQAFQPSFKL